MQNISNACFVISSVTSPSLSNVIILLNTFVNRYFTYFSFCSTWHTSKACANRCVFSFNCSKLISRDGTKTRLKLIYAIFLIATYVDSTKLAFFWMIKEYLFWYKKFLSYLIISLKSVHIFQKGYINNNFVLRLGIWCRLLIATLAYVDDLFWQFIDGVDFLVFFCLWQWAA